MTEPCFLLVDPASLPTHLARVAGRVNQAGSASASESFLLASYAVEATIKTLAVALCAGLRRSSTAALYRFEYELVRADGLGAWDAMISACTTESYSGYVHKDLQPLLTWLTQKRTKQHDLWAREAGESCNAILADLGATAGTIPNRFNIRYLTSQLVQIRNKTKAHGAVGEEFFLRANPHYLSAVHALIAHCPLFAWDWLFLAERPTKASIKAVRLRGPSPVHLREHEATALQAQQQGIYFRVSATSSTLHFCGDLFQTDWECQNFLLPNGGMSEAGQAEFLDYTTGRTRRFELARLLAAPAAPPPSATEGLPALDVYSNVFGNLPPLHRGYVQRPQLQEELRTRIDDTNHPIITLHGRGGIGKTSLALHLAHTLADSTALRFDHILWLSARDLELKPTGTSEVRRAVPSLTGACKLLADFLDMAPDPEALAQVLQDPACIASCGLLLIFDNFETLDEPRSVHQFLDTHTHLPNKVLITSRERAFKGDYPIEVGGMEFAEAAELLSRESRSLGVEHIIDDDAIEQIFKYTDGHAYVMRVIVGEVAKDKRWVPLKSLVPRRADLLSAVFERSFNKLTPDGRWVFLTVANWRSVVTELAMLVVLGLSDLDVEAGIEECLNLSLITRAELVDGQACYYAPELARLFARKKLEGDPDRLAIMEDLQVLQQFGPVRQDQTENVGVAQSIGEFISHLKARVATGDDSAEQVDRLLIRVAELWPRGWLDLAKFRLDRGLPSSEVAYAFRRAVEERPYDKQMWIERAEYSHSVGDDDTYIASLVSAADIVPKDVALVREVAFQLCKYVDAHKYEIPPVRRGVYLASVRSHMMQLTAQLDAVGLSRLAWLFLLEGDAQAAWRYANLGLERESTNVYCLKIVERLNNQGFGEVT